MTKKKQKTNKQKKKNGLREMFRFVIFFECIHKDEHSKFKLLFRLEYKPQTREEIDEKATFRKLID